MTTFFFVILAYLFGSIPIGVLLAKRAGIDVRRVGSGNIGAANVARSVGKGLGLLTLLGDMGKGLMPVLGARFLGVGDAALSLVALAAFLGHLFSVFLKFSGGKGVATGLGVFLGLAPQAMCVPVTIFLVVFLSTRIVSLSSIIAALSAPAALAFWHYPGASILTGLVVALLIAFRHRDNIRRLFGGVEPKFHLSKSGGARDSIAEPEG